MTAHEVVQDDVGPRRPEPVCVKPSVDFHQARRADFARGAPFWMQIFRDKIKASTPQHLANLRALQERRPRRANDILWDKFIVQGTQVLARRSIEKVFPKARNVVECFMFERGQHLKRVVLLVNGEHVI